MDSRPRLAVAWAIAVIAAPVLVQGLTRLLSAWTGDPHPATVITLAAVAPPLLAGAVAIARGITSPLVPGCSRSSPPPPSSPPPRPSDGLRAQNDRLVAKLYVRTDPELAHLLRSFKVMAAKRPEYLTLLQ